MEECESPLEIFRKVCPLYPKVGVGASGSLVQACLGGGIEEKGFGVGDDQEVAGLWKEFQDPGRRVDFGTWDRLLPAAGGGEQREKVAPSAALQGGDERAAAHHSASKVGRTMKFSSVTVADDVGGVG